MSDVVETYSIQSPEEALSPALNYQNLRNIGLATIIQTGSENWTDYNEHDPGITILEMLIYSLTDLAYRTDFPITDIIAQQKLSTKQLAEKQFYTARDILTVNPVTLNDLRKILIDQPGVGNAWIQMDYDPLNTFGGILEVLIDPDPAPQNKQEEQALIGQINASYYRHRNLGQDLGAIILRQPLEILLNLELIINPTAVAESVVAEVLFELENHLSSTVDFLSLSEMMVEINGVTNEVFNGPALQHGFLTDDALLPMLSELRAIDLIPILLNTPEVAAVNSLGLRTLAQQEAALVKSMGDKNSGANQGKWFHQINIAKNQSPCLAPLDQQQLIVWKGDTPCELNWNQLAFELKKLQSKKRQSKLVAQTRDLPIPLGNFRDIEHYLSIQQEFPKIYGLDPFGPPPDATTTHLAQIKQLKAYLLLFDQMMADYLAQLANLGQLFSWDTDVVRTYYFQGLETSVANLGELLVGAPIELEKSDKGHPNKQGLFQALEDYKAKLARFQEDEKTFLSRRNRFLDHLLARFGRDLTSYTEAINQRTLEEQQKIALETKLRVLNQYPVLSAQRGRAHNRFHNQGFAKELSGLRLWVETLFDMAPENWEVFHFNKRFLQKNYTPKLDEQHVFSKYVLATKDDSKLDLKEIMRIGSDRDNYRVEHQTKTNDHQIILYKITDPLQPFKIYKVTDTYSTPEETIEVIDDLAQLIGQYDKTSERIYLVEHLLLRPTPIEYYFGLSLLDETGAIWLQTQTWYTKETLAQILSPPDPETQFYYCIDKEMLCTKKVIDQQKSTVDKVVYKMLTAKYTFSIEAIDPTASFIKYQVKLKVGATGSVIDLTSVLPFESKEIAKKSIQKWMNRLEKHFTTTTPSATSAPLWKPELKPWGPALKKGSKYKNILADPYSFVLTVVIPKWPSRFQNKSFKKSLERAIQSECPAHLWPNILWLGKNKFQQFQNLRKMWWNAYVQEEPDAYAYRKELMTFIMTHSLPKSVFKKKTSTPKSSPPKNG